MRFFIGILLSLVLFASCKTSKFATVDHAESDTLKFTYLYSEALKNAMLGQTETAYSQFIKCLEINPKSSASAYQISLMLLDKEDFIEARKYADFCIKLMPDNEWYLLVRATIAKELNEPKLYQDIYKKLAELFPTNFNYLFELAIIQYQNKNYDEALKLLSSLEDEVGINENISFLRNNINFALDRFDAIQLELLNLRMAFPDSTKYSDMLAEFYLRFNQPANAFRMYQDILDKDSTNAEALFGISWIYGKLNKFTDGYASLIQCLKCVDISFERKLKVANLYLDAVPNPLSDDAIVQIFELLVKEPDLTSDILGRYITYLYKKKDLSDAERVALVSINKFPDNYTAWDYYFNILLLQNRPEALNKYSLKGLEYFPNHALVYFYCGYSYFLLRDYNNAVNYLEMGIDYIVDDNNLLNQFYLTLAESYHNLGKHKQSDSYFDRYLENDSTNAYLMNNYAYYLVQRNTNLTKSLDLSRKSIELEPFNSSFLDTYSWILYKKGDYEKSLNYISRAYKYGGNKNAVILDHFGDILFKLGNTEEAVLRWKDAYKLNNSESILQKINEVNNN